MDFQKLKKKLQEEKARLQKDIEVTAPIAATDHVGYSTHQADDASDVFEQTKNATVHNQLQWLLGEVEHALAKLANGTYGKCEACGRPIADARLEVLPTARFCIDDQQKMEKKVLAS